ncbi:MAG: MaoC/PaaZ C-terminal domain-containing protein [Chloroflexi bacterium]|nr:MaoC/PaaZ C-terminal domain-containing protein [Chloroflexota bacterium]
MPPLSLTTVRQAIGKEIWRTSYTYNERDAVLYALGIGAPSDPLDADELKFVYECSNDFQVLPTFAVIFAQELFEEFLSGELAGIRYDPMMMVHGEQHLDVFKPLPRAATVESAFTIADIYDKGSGLLLIVEVTSTDEGGLILAKARNSAFIRGLGGFGGDRGSSTKADVPVKAPDRVHEERTMTQQALLYRLAGDPNPLHADPSMAAVGGYEKPILHGLCSYGFAARAIIKHFCENDSHRLCGLDVRFSHHVFPGETLLTEMWRHSPSEVRFRTQVKERSAVVLSHGCARIKA